MASKTKSGRRVSGNPAARTTERHTRQPGLPSVPHQAAVPTVTLDPGEGATVSFDFGNGLSLPEVQYTFTMFPHARERAIRDGWGFGIELPTVLDILDHVAKGKVDAAIARDLLLHGARELYVPMECHRYEDENELEADCMRAPQACPVCRSRRDWFEAFLDTADQRWSQFTQPETYTFIAGRSGLHQIDCPVVRREMPDQYARPAGDTYVSELRRYAHSVDPSSGLSDLEYARQYPHWDAMTATEARKWRAERTGPKGGRNYKSCGRCAPSP